MGPQWGLYLCLIMGFGFGCGSAWIGSGGVSSGGASAPSGACAAGLPFLPLDLLVPDSLSFGSASSSTFRRSMLSSPAVSLNSSSGSALPLPVLVNVAVAMPVGWCDLPPQGVVLVFTIC